MIIGLSGSKGSGKDTVANSIIDLFSHKARCRKIAFADPIKKEIQHIFDLDPSNEKQYDLFKRTQVVYDLPGYSTHSISGRHVVREIGMLMRRYNTEQFIEYVGREIDRAPNDIWIITDLRFDNEYMFLKERGAVIVKVTKPDLPHDAHITERGFDDNLCDVVFVNDKPLHHIGMEVVKAFDSIINKEYK